MMTDDQFEAFKVWATDQAGAMLHAPEGEEKTVDTARFCGAFSAMGRVFPDDGIRLGNLWESLWR